MCPSPCPSPCSASPGHAPVSPGTTTSTAKPASTSTPNSRRSRHCGASRTSRTPAQPPPCRLCSEEWTKLHTRHDLFLFHSVMRSFYSLFPFFHSINISGFIAVPGLVFNWIISAIVSYVALEVSCFELFRRTSVLDLLTRKWSE